MEVVRSPALFDTTPEEALSTLANHDGPIIVDFDETLYLRNSTSEFLASARPSIVAYGLVKILDVIRPWRWTGGAQTRDAWRVRTISSLMPWTVRNWRRRSRSIAEEALNHPLLKVLQETDADVCIATLGFAPIVGPLLQHAGLDGVSLVAAHPWKSADLTRGKLALVEEAVGREAVGRSAVLTDSAADDDLLAASQTPLKVVWPDASPREVFSDIYAPGRYVSGVKRPGSRYVRRKILREDFALWVLSSVWLSTYPLAHIAGLVALAVSFWAVYEIGYVDNDLIAKLYEKDPKLSVEARRRDISFPVWKPLVWSTIAGGLALWLLAWPSAPPAGVYLAWTAVLLSTFAVFKIYNRLDKRTRILLFPILQLLRTAAFVAVVPIAPIAALALGVHVMIRWVNYYVYRLRDGRWPDSDLSIVRLVAFASVAVLFASGGQWSTLTSPTAISLFAWHLLLIRKELPAALSAAHRIDRPR